MFKSQDLAKSIAALDPLADTFKKKADEASEDIRQLEKYLSEKFIGIEIGLNIQDHKVDDEHMKLFELADHEKVGGFLLREILIWGKDESNQKFRLLYEKHLLNGSKNGGYQVYSEKKPLIECSLFDRLRIRSKLPQLIDHITNCLTWT